MDLRNAEDAKTFVTGLGDVLREIWYNKKTLPALAYVLAAYDVVNKKPYGHIEPLPICQILPDGTDLGKDGFSRLLHAAAKAMQAVGVVFCSESWAHIGGLPEGVTPENIYDKYDSLESVPGREEVIFVSLEHKEIKEPFLLFARITRNPDTLGPFQDLYAHAKAIRESKKGESEAIDPPELGEETSGRFTHFIK